MKNSYIFEPIGFIESCYKDKFGVPRQSGLVSSAQAVLRIRPELQPELVLQGLEGFSHIWLIWVFHKNISARFRAKIHPPRLEGETMGVFATRTPHRPNPIGLSLVKIEKIEGDRLWLSGIDVVDETPVLDIKPYLPEADIAADARVGWTQGAERAPLRVTFAHQCQEALIDLQKRNPEARVADIIEKTIQLDPRPEIYRGEKESGGWRRHPIHAFRLFGGDVHFRMLEDEVAEVFQIDVEARGILPSRLPKNDASITSSGITNEDHGIGG